MAPPSGLADDASTVPDQAPPGLYDESGRPRFFSDPAVDRLISVVLQLTSEVWVLTERLANIEQLAEAKGCVLAAQIRNYKPAPEQEKLRDADRDRFIHTVLGPLREVRK